MLNDVATNVFVECVKFEIKSGCSLRLLLAEDVVATALAIGGTPDWVEDGIMLEGGGTDSGLLGMIREVVELSVT